MATAPRSEIFVSNASSEPCDDSSRQCDASSRRCDVSSRRCDVSARESGAVDDAVDRPDRRIRSLVRPDRSDGRAARSAVRRERSVVRDDECRDRRIRSAVHADRSRGRCIRLVDRTSRTARPPGVIDRLRRPIVCSSKRIDWLPVHGRPASRSSERHDVAARVIGRANELAVPCGRLIGWSNRLSRPTDRMTATTDRVAAPANRRSSLRIAGVGLHAHTLAFFAHVLSGCRSFSRRAVSPSAAASPLALYRETPAQ